MQTSTFGNKHKKNKKYQLVVINFTLKHTQLLSYEHNFLKATYQTRTLVIVRNKHNKYRQTIRNLDYT